ncbi:hypothetical protein [Clostridium beijerinckii]|uniref:hypothetical protein n=1 Tax=Clostridium beijerinckii TaxID=1520 RepID=UPI00098CABE4|nr:hypothetical protein [Clostridium beijerinckii]MBA8936476.1 hypothetical protein [Clostridium beijerinckii]NOW02459.1 hypothetical protein [Clostridium beijerinckii]NRU41056.1 hypothetical protein [Clostridium beijerinckii]NSA95669.1 hypothetical protein [Clostridium beijerinckii]NYC05581.1 hypothetical protein [Clostridium beijerinckii]
MSENVFLKIDGEWFTDFIRTLYYADDKSYEECKEKLLLSLCLEDISNDDKEELAQAIIFGDKKFIGVNSLELVDDTDFDVYNYSRFSRPKFNENCRGIRGILMKEGIFVPCEFQGHASAIDEIGIDKCKGALQFWMGLMGAGVSKDEQKIEITKYQKKFFEENRRYMGEEQIRDWELLIDNEILRKEYNLV